MSLFPRSVKTLPRYRHLSNAVPSSETKEVSDSTLFFISRSVSQSPLLSPPPPPPSSRLGGQRCFSSFCPPRLCSL